MTVRVAPPLALVTLLERLRAMRSAIDNAGSLEHRRARAAAQHFEFEVEPLLEQLDLDLIMQAIVEATLLEKYRLDKCQRVSMPINSGSLLCRRGDRVMVSTQIPRGAMRIERIVVPDEIAPFFKVHDIRISNRSQFVQEGAMSATVFAQSAPDPRPITYDVVQVAMRVDIDVEYVGDVTNGLEFMATAIGIEPREHDRVSMSTDEARVLLGAWQQIVGQ